SASSRSSSGSRRAQAASRSFTAASGAAAQPVGEQRARLLPVALDRALGEAEQAGRLLDRATGEEAQLDQLGQTGVVALERGERLVDGECFGSLRLDARSAAGGSRGEP